MGKSKRLIQVETGVWIDPDHVVAIHPIAIGTRGYARIVFDTGDTIDCQEHEAIVAGKADPTIIEDLMQQVVDQMLHELDGSYRP